MQMGPSEPGEAISLLPARSVGGFFQTPGTGTTGASQQHQGLLDIWLWVKTNGIPFWEFR